MRRYLRWRVGGQVAALVALIGLAIAQPVGAQSRPFVPPTASFGRAPTNSTLSSRIANGSLRHGTTPTVGRGGAASPLGRAGIITTLTRNGPQQQHHRRNNIILPGQGTPARGPIIRPGPQPNPNARIIRPGEERRRPSQNRRIIVPGQPETDTPTREPLIVAVNGRSVDAMARTLRSVGEHRIAAALCRQAGGCSDGRSPRALNADVRRGAVSIRLPIETRRLIYSANNRVAPNEDEEGELTQMPRLTRVHGRNDPIAQRAYDKAGVILSFYRTVLGRRSFDDRNSPTRFVVHYGYDEDNAAWNSADESTFGHPIATFGDGNEESRAQVEGDIPYHEFTHGVVDYEANFVYEGESGALHEHFADALGETAEQWERGESVHDSDWLFGEGTFHVGSRDGATRSFANPNLYGQPGHVREMAAVDRSDDHGGVHTLSGVPNRAFYGAAMRLGGHAWDHVGVIWYAALRDHLGRHATFRDTAQATVRSAAELFGPRSREAAAVRASWAEVGIRVPLGRGGMPPRLTNQVFMRRGEDGATPDDGAAEARRRH